MNRDVNTVIVDIFIDQSRECRRPATDVQDSTGISHAREVDQQGSQSPAPATHLQIVADAIGCQERR